MQSSRKVLHEDCNVAPSDRSFEAAFEAAFEASGQSALDPETSHLHLQHSAYLQFDTFQPLREVIP